jgi:hypothetical protein
MKETALKSSEDWHRRPVFFKPRLDSEGLHVVPVSFNNDEVFGSTVQKYLSTQTPAYKKDSMTHTIPPNTCVG